MTTPPARNVVRTAPRASADKTLLATPERPALSPQSWINAATEVLVDQGIDHVRVDVLAKQLQVTRGSFYWHFRDREQLLRSVLDAWRALATEQLTARLESAHSDPREQLRDVLSLPVRGRAAVRAARIELAIRAWARRNETARHAVDEADASRMGYIAQIFSALGFAPGEARSRAFLLYAYLVGESLLTKPGLKGQQRERSQLAEQLLQQSLPR